MSLKRKASQIKAVHQHCEIHWAGKDKAASQPGIRALIKGHAMLQVLVPSAILPLLFISMNLSTIICCFLSSFLPHSLHPSLPHSTLPFFFSFSLSLSFSSPYSSPPRLFLSPLFCLRCATDSRATLLPSSRDGCLLRHLHTHLVLFRTPVTPLWDACPY